MRVARPHVEIVEVAPRDGLQNEAVVLNVAQKVELIERLEACGVARIEAVSFVNERRVPQMAGAEAVMAALPRRARRSRIGLALNLKGWERAVAAQCDEVNLVVCASDAFGVANQKATVADQLEALAAIAEQRALKGGPALSVTVAVAFGDPFAGDVSEAQVLRVARAAAEAGAHEIALADTIGVADPWTVRQRFEAVRALAPNTQLRAHFHDTRNTGLANAYASLLAGVDAIDASCGGIGGCPFAPNASGNIATEDLVYMLERAGFDTGLDLDGLIETATWIGRQLKKTVPSALWRAGRPQPQSVTGLAS